MGFVSILKAGRPIKARTEKTATYGKLLSLSNRQGGIVHADLMHGFQTFKKRINDEELAQAWATGDTGRITKVIPWDRLPEDLEPAMKGIEHTTFLAGGLSIGALPPQINKHLRWDTSNPEIKNYLKSRTGELVVGVSDDTREVIHNAVARSFNEALTPRQVAAQIKDSIGLYPKQERALANYRLGLMKQGVKPQRIETMCDSYEDRLLDYRANMIARTETRGATNMGQLSVWREGAKQDLFSKTQAKRVWIVDGDPCEICLAMDGIETGLDEPWILEDGTPVDCPPWDVHPHCFCGMELEFNTNEDEGDDS